MIEAASLGLANSLTDEERAVELVYPRIERIREISAQIALSVIRAAQEKVLYTFPALLKSKLMACSIGCGQVDRLEAARRQGPLDTYRGQNVESFFLVARVALVPSKLC